MLARGLEYRFEKPAGDDLSETINGECWFCCCQDEGIVSGVAVSGEIPTLQIDYKWNLENEGIAGGYADFVRLINPEWSNSQRADSCNLSR